jgi:hypothetical protein
MNLIKLKIHLEFIINHLLEQNSIDVLNVELLIHVIIGLYSPYFGILFNHFFSSSHHIEQVPTYSDDLGYESDYK